MSKTRTTPDILARFYWEAHRPGTQGVLMRKWWSGLSQRLCSTSNADHVAESGGQTLGNITEKMPAWNTSTVQSKQDVINEAKANNTTHFRTLMDLCHLRHAELAEHMQKKKKHK